MLSFKKGAYHDILNLETISKKKGDLSMQLSVQGYLQQRKRLNPEIFP